MFSDRQKSVDEGSIQFSPFSRILLGGLVKLRGTYNFSFFCSLLLHDSTPKVELLGKKGSGNRFLIESCPQEDRRK